jgi:hypothetical protein
MAEVPTRRGAKDRALCLDNECNVICFDPDGPDPEVDFTAFLDNDDEIPPNFVGYVGVGSTKCKIGHSERFVRANLTYISMAARTT